MKRISTRIALFTAATLISALPVFAGESGGMSGDQMQKDECLLVSQNCRDSVDTLQQRIDRISREISKGSSTYTPQELQRLRGQLQDANDMMIQLTQGGGA